VYTASSVVKSIRASKNCTHEHLDYVKCPRDRCNVNPVNCSPGKAHICPHEINVFDNKTNGLIKIVFYFTISPADHDGFISKEDSQLRELFDRNIITRAALKPTTVVFL
jgi:hypothetical protein